MAHHGNINSVARNNMAKKKVINVNRSFHRIKQLSGTIRVNMFFCFSFDMLEDVKVIQSKISEFNKDKDGLMYVHCVDWIDYGLMSFPVDKEDRPQRVFNEAILDCDFVVFSINDNIGKYLTEEWELCKNRNEPQLFLVYKWTQHSKKTVEQRRNEMGVNDRIIDCVFSSPEVFADKIIARLRKICDNRQLEINKIVQTEDQFIRLPKHLRQVLLKKYSGTPLSESYIKKVMVVNKPTQALSKVRMIQKAKYRR